MDLYRQRFGEPIEALPVAMEVSAETSFAPPLAPSRPPPTYANQDAEDQDFTPAQLDRAVSVSLLFYVPAGVLGMIGLLAFPNENALTAVKRVDLRVWIAAAVGVALGASAAAFLAENCRGYLFREGEVFMNDSLAQAARKHAMENPGDPFITLNAEDGTTASFPAASAEALERYERRENLKLLLFLMYTFLFAWLIVGLVGVLRTDKDLFRFGAPRLFSIWIVVFVAIAVPTTICGRWEMLSPVLLCRKPEPEEPSHGGASRGTHVRSPPPQAADMIVEQGVAQTAREALDLPKRASQAAKTEQDLEKGEANTAA